MQSRWFRAIVASGAAILVASTYSHAPLHWFLAASGSFRASVPAEDLVEKDWALTAVDGPEIEGSVFGWRRLGGGGTDENIREYAAEIDRLSLPTEARSASRAPGAVGEVRSTLTTTVYRTLLLTADPARTTASVVGSGVSSIAPQVSQALRTGASIGLSDLGFNSDSSLRFGAPYTGGVGGAIARRIFPPIGSGVGSGGTPPAVGGSVPEPGCAGILVLMLGGFARRPRRLESSPASG